VFVVEFCDGGNEILEGAAKPVQAPDNDGIPLPGVVLGLL
jgi:hypothetical protein